MTTAILVDWGLYQTNPAVRDFITAREDDASIVVLVDDKDTTLDRDFDVTIRNTGGLHGVKFKIKALDVLNELSDLDIVVALDPSDSISEVYKSMGVLITYGDVNFATT